LNSGERLCAFAEAIVDIARIAVSMPNKNRA